MVSAFIDSEVKKIVDAEEQEYSLYYIARWKKKINNA